MASRSRNGLIEYHVEHSIALISFNRPEKLNAFSDEMVKEFAAVLHEFDTDGRARVAILKGNGRAFSSGADVHQRQLRGEAELRRNGGSQGWGAHASDLLTRSVNWKPVIAAPHGYAVGLGLGLVLESDLVVAEAGTRFQVTETSRGLAASRYWSLMNYRGSGSFASDVALTGRFFTAEEAFAAGLVNHVAPNGESLNVAYELANQVAKHPPLAVRATVRTRRWYMEQVEREAYLQTDPLKLYLSEDFVESATAFAEKREPREFYGR